MDVQPRIVGQQGQIGWVAAEHGGLKVVQGLHDLRLRPVYVHGDLGLLTWHLQLQIPGHAAGQVKPVVGEDPRRFLAVGHEPLEILLPGEGPKGGHGGGHVHGPLVVEHHGGMPRGPGGLKDEILSVQHPPYVVDVPGEIPDPGHGDGSVRDHVVEPRHQLRLGHGRQVSQGPICPQAPVQLPVEGTVLPGVCHQGPQPLSLYPLQLLPAHPVLPVGLGHGRKQAHGSSSPCLIHKVYPMALRYSTTQKEPGTGSFDTKASFTASRSGSTPGR